LIEGGSRTSMALAMVMTAVRLRGQTVGTPQARRDGKSVNDEDHRKPDDLNDTFLFLSSCRLEVDIMMPSMLAGGVGSERAGRQHSPSTGQRRQSRS
jgi:hypothetical protein